MATTLRAATDNSAGDTPARAPFAMFFGTGGAQARTSLRWRSIHDETRIEDASPPCDARTWTPPALKQHGERGTND
jgi:hypothetical protein